MLLALSLRTTVAVALAVAPTAPGATPSGAAGAAPGAVASPRTYDGADQAAPTEPAPDPAAPAADPPAIVPAPAAETPPMDARAPAAEGANVVTPPPTPEGPAEEDEADMVPYDPLVDSPEAIRARHWVRSGIVFLVVGGVLTAGAIAMSQAPINNPDTGAMPCNNRGDPAGNGCTGGGRTRATAALAVPGALMLAGGAAMLTVGKLQQKRLAASLHADRRGFQLGVTLRF